MKRSPIKRKTGLKRGKPPQRKKPLRTKTKTQKVAALQDRRLNPYSKYWLLWADELWAWIVKASVDWTCERTGIKPDKSKYIHAHHLVCRRHYPTRHDPANGIALIARKHKHNEDSDGPHGTMPWIFDAWLEEKHPKRWAYMKANNPLHRDNHQKGRPNWFARYQRLYLQAIEEDIDFIVIDKPRGRGEFPPLPPELTDGA